MDFKLVLAAKAFSVSVLNEKGAPKLKYTKEILQLGRLELD